MHLSKFRILYWQRNTYGSTSPWLEKRQRTLAHPNEQPHAAVCRLDAAAPPLPRAEVSTPASQTDSVQSTTQRIC
jgi:hypothetical protein